MKSDSMVTQVPRRRTWERALRSAGCSPEPLKVVEEVHGKARKGSIPSSSSCVALSWTTVQASDSEADHELRSGGFWL